MNRMKFLAVASLVLGAASLTPAHQIWAQSSPSAQASAPPAETGPTAGQTTPPTSKGEYVARAADCIACHSVPGGKAYTGGLKMGTPLGNIYSTNITPDKETGIGDYSYDDFERAVRQGVAKDGHRLYPAMPYPSYAKVTDDDMHLLYDFFMKEVPAVKQANKPSEITGIMGWRWPLAIWNVLFMDKGVYQQKSDHDAAWNRGAYLIEGLEHCGACHTPRGIAFQEKALDASSTTFLSGAELDAWYAPSLRGEARTGLGSWSHGDVAAFLKTGHNNKGVAFGSMIDVVNNSTPYLNDDDVNAMATYLKALSPTTQQAAYTYDNATTTALQAGKSLDAGGKLYNGYCLTCHGADGKGQVPFLPPLAGNPVVMDNDPSSLVNLVLNGAQTIVAKGVPDSYRMPLYRVQLTDDEIASVVSFVRNAWGNGAPAVTADAVKKLRPVTDPSNDHVIILKMR
ncbi:MAG TPA: cytochrome c [Rhizomicrobium sp.]|jgi:mono/diheme cytochrome c family protein|nr:cytochrome c [Rhizomicrobium sp.]